MHFRRLGDEAFIWTDDVIVYPRIYASLGLKQPLTYVVMQNAKFFITTQRIRQNLKYHTAEYIIWSPRRG